MPESDGLDPNAVRRQFARRGIGLADADFLYREIERQMLERLDVVRLAPSCVVDVGCGLGRGLFSLSQRYENALVLGIDSNAGAVRAAKGGLQPSWQGWLGKVLGGRLSSSSRMQIVQADATALPLSPASVDLVWSNLCYHWLNDLPAAMRESYRAIRPGGLLMFSMFGVDTLKEIRRHDDGLPTFADMHDIGDLLSSLGFADPVMDMQWITLTFDSAERVLHDLRALGGNPSRSRSKGLMPRAKKATWLAALEAMKDAGGRINITFEIVFGHAWCPAQKRRSDGLEPVQVHRRGT